MILPGHQRLRVEARIVAGDICGAFSEPKYARKGQRFVARMIIPGYLCLTTLTRAMSITRPWNECGRF